MKAAKIFIPEKIVVVILSMLLVVSCSKKQSTEPEEPEHGEIEWVKTFGGSSSDIGYSVQQTADGGYIIVGETESFGSGPRDIYCIKTDTQGNTQWTKTYGGTEHEKGESIRETNDGGYIIVGSTSSFGAGAYDVYLIKTDASGDTQWTRTYGGALEYIGSSIQQTSDGGYIVCGHRSTSGLDEEDVYLVKTNGSGDSIWVRTYGGVDDQWGYSVQQTSDGGYIVAGYTGEYPDVNVYLLKLDASGDTMWTRNYGGTNEDVGYSVQQTSDGGYIIAGWTESFGSGNRDAYLIRTDANGNAIWSKTFGGTRHDRGYSVQETADGGFVIAGYTWSFGSNGDAYLIKTDSSGDTLWTKYYGGTDWEKGYSIQQTSDGGYIICGEVEDSGTGDSDVYLIKTEP